MPIAFKCPHCGAQTSVSEQYAGQTGPCASCGKPVTVPPLAGTPGYAPPAKKSGGSSVVVIVLVVLLGLFVVCGGIMAALLIPAVQAAREAARRAQCMNNLKQIGLALHNYHDTHRCFPPAVITDEEGRPMRSWRVAILPYMEESVLHDQYDYDEPWDGPNNSTLADLMPQIFRCPSDVQSGLGETSYVMVTGEGTVGGEPNEAVRFPDIMDGTSNTIMVVEVTGAGIHWMEPRDLTIDEIMAGINDPSGSGICSDHPGGAIVLLADGSVRFLSDSIDMELLKSLLTRDEGEIVGEF